MKTKKGSFTFEKYGKWARGTAIYPSKGKNFVYPTLGLCGETGEVSEKVKKILRDKEGVLKKKDREELKKELGDVLWYLANLASELGLSLEEIALGDISKLSSREKRGKLQGEGDNR
jgi:NTP pyrophosphatase (non-canonical NTP hydrolase)